MRISDRIRAWPSTALGLAAAGVVALHAALGCTVPLTSWRAWGPAVGLAVWGALIKGKAG
jgi:hypothetical protein